MIFKERFLSEIHRLPVLNIDGENVGIVKDLLVIPDFDFPKLTNIIVGNKKEEVIIPIEMISTITKTFVFLKIKDLVSFLPPENAIYLQRDILDKQIVDTERVKIMRVNDIKLSQVDKEIRLVAADVGITGILRRMNLENIVKKIFTFFNYQLNDYLISWAYLERLERDLSRIKLNISHQKLAKLHPSDIAHIINQLDEKERIAVFSSLDIDKASEVIHELKEEISVSIIEKLDVDKAVKILEKMPSDEATDLLQDLNSDDARELLSLMQNKAADDVKELLKYEEDTAGGLMTTEYITFSKDLTCEEVIENLRELAPSAETIYYLYVVDENEQLAGVLSLRNLIVSDPKIPIANIMYKKVIYVDVDTSKEEVARLISKYNFLALPVLDKDKKICGIITVDDVVDLIVPTIPKYRGF